MTDIGIAPVTDALRLAAIKNGWFRNDITNRLRGFGRGPAGIAAALEAHVELLSRIDGGDTSVSIVGIYRDYEPIGYFSAIYLGDHRRTVQIDLVFEDEAGADLREASGALEDLLDAIFTETGRVVFRVQAETISSRKKWRSFLKMNGFSEESRHEKAYWIGREGYDTVLLKVLRPQWDTLRKKRKVEVN